MLYSNLNQMTILSLGLLRNLDVYNVNIILSSLLFLNYKAMIEEET